MILLRPLLDHVDQLIDYDQAWCSIDELRPRSCPGCNAVAREPRQRFTIVGHGTYGRTVRGIEPGGTVTRIQRFLCRRCNRTISVLPDLLHPRRVYAGAVILESLRLHLIEEWQASEIRALFCQDGEQGHDWRSLRRWRRALLHSLWNWCAKRLGVKGDEADTRTEGRRRLWRLLAEVVPMHTRAPANGEDMDISWPDVHAPPEFHPRGAPE